MSRVMQWQPIETAPKDGTDILIGVLDHPILGNCVISDSWDVLDGRWVDWTGDAPTHWVPMPSESPSPALSDLETELLGALKDMIAGWRYIRTNHGDLYGVGWDRTQNAAEAAIARAEGRS